MQSVGGANTGSHHNSGDARKSTAGVTSLHAPPAAPPGLIITTRLGKETGNRCINED